MTDQLTLFPQAPAQRHSETSKAAAEKITPKLGFLQTLVRTALAAHPEGLTDEELGNLLELEGSTLRPRRIELVRMGKVKAKLKPDGSTETRVGKSGRLATVWVLG